MNDLATLHQTRLACGFYEVPCNGCTKCCHNDAVRILPHEDATKWKTEAHPYMTGARMLAHQANGDCHYLGATGCTIQRDKPQVCQEMDCRLIARTLTRSQALKLDRRGAMRIEIWNRGRELLRTPVATIESEAT